MFIFLLQLVPDPLASLSTQLPVLSKNSPPPQTNKSTQTKNQLDTKQETNKQTATTTKINPPNK